MPTGSANEDQQPGNYESPLVPAASIEVYQNCGWKVITGREEDGLNRIVLTRNPDDEDYSEEVNITDREVTITTTYFAGSPAEISVRLLYERFEEEDGNRYVLRMRSDSFARGSGNDAGGSWTDTLYDDFATEAQIDIRNDHHDFCAPIFPPFIMDLVGLDQLLQSPYRVLSPENRYNLPTQETMREVFRPSLEPFAQTLQTAGWEPHQNETFCRRLFNGTAVEEISCCEGILRYSILITAREGVERLYSLFWEPSAVPGEFENSHCSVGGNAPRPFKGATVLTAPCLGLTGNLRIVVPDRIHLNDLVHLARANTVMFSIFNQAPGVPEYLYSREDLRTMAITATNGNRRNIRAQGLRRKLRPENQGS